MQAFSFLFCFVNQLQNSRSRQQIKKQKKREPIIVALDRRFVVYTGVAGVEDAGVEDAGVEDERMDCLLYRRYVYTGYPDLSLRVCRSRGTIIPSQKKIFYKLTKTEYFLPIFTKTLLRVLCDLLIMPANVSGPIDDAYLMVDPGFLE